MPDRRSRPGSSRPLRLNPAGTPANPGDTSPRTPVGPMPPRQPAIIAAHGRGRIPRPAMLPRRGFLNYAHNGAFHRRIHPSILAPPCRIAARTHANPQDRRASSTGRGSAASSERQRSLRHPQRVLNSLPQCWHVLTAATPTRARPRASPAAPCPRCLARRGTRAPHPARPRRASARYGSGPRGDRTWPSRRGTARR